MGAYGLDSPPPRLGWRDHRRPWVIETPENEFLVQLQETLISWHQPKHSDKQIFYF